MTEEVVAVVPKRSPLVQGLELVATAVALAAAGASGAQLFALSATGRWKFSDLLFRVGVPAAAVLVVVLVVAILMGWQRLRRGILLGFAAGAIATMGLEAVRITGFRVFHSMPGDLPTLMGVQATDRIMLGPNTSSTIVGYLDHFWNGAMFGVIFALIVGGFPAARRAWTGAAIGALYGLAMGFGFASGPLPRTLGIGGGFSTVTVAEFQTTIYLAHLVFGVLLGLLVHAFGSRIPPLWTPALDVVKSIAGSRHTVAGVRSNHE